MSTSGTPNQAGCPCGSPTHPASIANPPGLTAISYRQGDYPSFRHALLLPRAGETQLTRTTGGQVAQIWRPGAQGDLAVQLIEWWACLCDIITFYNERIANQNYLGTADLPESVNRLVNLLGYRPRPGIGATGVLAALTTGPNAVTLPVGFQVQNKPGPGQDPQVFELREAVTFQPSPIPLPPGAVQGAIPLLPPPEPSQIAGVNSSSPGTRGTMDGGNALLKGVSGAIATGDDLLLMNRQFVGADRNYALVRVTGIAQVDDPSGNTNTRLTYVFTFRGADFPTTAAPADFRLLKSGQSSHLYQYVIPTLVSIGQNTIDLDSIVRQIRVGDPVLLNDARPVGANPPQLVSITSYSEVIYYANNPANPSVPPPGSDGSFSGAPPQPAIPIPHTRLSFTPVLDSPWDATVAQVLYGWLEVGQLIDTPAATFGSSSVGSPDANPLVLNWDKGSSVPSAGADVLIQDANGKGATGTVVGNGVRIDNLDQPLASPIQALFNLLTVSRGKSVANEILGSGNALVAGQDFVLQNAPVTYLQDPRSVSGQNYSSTVRVWVNQLEWKEVQSFYGEAPSAQVFVTREDEQGKTHVVCGDGVNGSRLPTGVNNVIASYRYGSGASAPQTGSLTVVAQPQPGLQSLLNPAPVGGGADPDPPARVRRLAPRSLLTLGRAVSIADFEAIALQSPSVTRAMAALRLDHQSQRPGVTVWVGDDVGAVTAARSAFAAAADPNRQPQVVLAKKVIMALRLTVVYDTRRVAQTIREAVRIALIDPDAGLFGLNVVTIGQEFYDSQIYAACLAVPGVVSVHSLRFGPVSPSSRLPATAEQRHDPGPGAYFALATDGQQPDIVMEPAS